MNGQLYALCRAGTDPAITEALEIARSPWGKIQKAAKNAIDWGQVEEITSNLLRAKLEAVEIDE